MGEPAPSGPRQWFFDMWSRFYDLPLVQRGTYRPVQDVVVSQLATMAGLKRVLDVGCGTGILASRLRASYPSAQIVGCDYSAGMLEQAARRDGSISWVQADAQALPLAGVSVDAICCTESFHWYPDQSGALREFRRVLRPGGVLLLGMVNPPVREVTRTVNRFSGIMGQPAKWLTPAHLMDLVGEAGFDVQDRIRVRRFPPSRLMPTIVTVAT